MAASTTVLVLMSLLPSLSDAIAPPSPFWRRASVPAAGFYNASDNGGSWLTGVEGTIPAGQGEPLNAIISGASDNAVLVNQATDGGLLNLFLSWGYSTECLGQHEGDPQTADLGDGHGYVNQTAEIRWDYGNPEIGTCQETIDGGSHFRYWFQNGPLANSGAVFLAVSYEFNLSDGHDIMFNGYNLGRDWFVGNVTNRSSIIDTAVDNGSSSYVGQTSYGGYTYRTSVQYEAGYIENTSYNINHNWSVSSSTVNASDGLVAVLNVQIVDKPTTSFAVPSITWPSSFALLLSCIAVLLSF